MSIPAQCVEKTSVLRVKVEDNGMKAIFLNNERASYEKIRVDKCICDNNCRAADFVVRKADVGDVIIELKGKNVHEAVEQVMATAKMWVQKNWQEGKIAALIVATRCPPRNTTFKQRAQQAFSKRYGGPLHIASSQREFEFEMVLSFRGP